MVTTGSVWVVSRLVAMQPPWSIATSTIPDPGRICCNSSALTSWAPAAAKPASLLPAPAPA